MRISMQIRGYAGWWLIIAGSVALAVYLFSKVGGADSWGMVGIWSAWAAGCLLWAYKTYRDMEKYRTTIEAAGAGETPSL